VYHDLFSADNAIPQANVVGRSLMHTTRTICVIGFYSAPCIDQELFIFTPYIKILGESSKNAS